MKALWISATIFLIVGLGMLTGGFFLWRSQADLLDHALHADGSVTDLMDNPKQYQLDISFLPKGG